MLAAGKVIWVTLFQSRISHKSIVYSYELTNETKKFNSAIGRIFTNYFIAVIVHEDTHIQHSLQVHSKVFCSVVRKFIQHFANVLKIVFHSKGGLVSVV